MVIKAICYIVCPCRQKHLLKPGLSGPVYWCGDELRELQGGDEVEIEDEKDFLWDCGVAG